MYVRMLTGRYKGEVREASPAAARAMLADGRAERFYPAVDAPGPIAAEPVAAEPIESGKPSGSLSPASEKHATKQVKPVKTIRAQASKRKKAK